VFKRAWIQQRPAGGDKDWAGTGRYLNVAVVLAERGRPGVPADFPIYNNLPDEQILLTFVYMANTVTGLKRY